MFSPNASAGRRRGVCRERCVVVREEPLARTSSGVVAGRSRQMLRGGKVV